MENKTLKPRHIGLLVLAALLITGIVYGFSFSRRVMAKADRLVTLAGGLREFDPEDLDRDDISRAVELSRQISRTLDSIRDDVDPLLPISKNLAFLPKIGKYMPALEPGMDYASALVDAAIILGETAEPLLDRIENGSSTNATRILTEFVKENQYNFSLVEEKLNTAIEASREIDPEILPGQYRDDFVRVNGLLEKSPAVFDAVEVVPYLLGDGAPITYLVTVQNKDELRATGGFITAFGLIRLRDGRIIGMRVDDSTNYHQFNYVSEVRDAPFPLKEIMFAHYFVARDANWSPDFPSAAKLVQEMYALSVDEPVDGVVAFDQEFIVRLLEFTGPLYLEENGETITAENAEEKMIEFKVSAEEEGNALERKEFLSTMAPIIMQEVSGISDPSELISLAKLVTDAFLEGHLLMQINDPDVQAVLENLEADGAVRPGVHDYLMLVDSNVGIGKIDQFIERSLSYEVDLQNPAQPVGKIKMRYMHTEPGFEACLQGSTILNPDLIEDSYNFSRCYWNYWRVVLPADTILLNSDYREIPEEYFLYEKKWDDAPMVAKGEAGTTVISGLTVVEQENEQEVYLETGLPPGVIEIGENDGLIYRLRVQKQPGIIALPVEITVKPPEGYTLPETAGDWEWDGSNAEATWKGKISRTTDFEVVFIINTAE